MRQNNHSKNWAYRQKNFFKFLRENIQTIPLPILMYSYYTIMKSYRLKYPLLA